MKSKLLKLDFYFVAVVCLASVFFVGTSSYNFITQKNNWVKWNSPDETANYYFAKSYATSHTLSKFEPANIIASDLVIPRSIKSDHGWLKPVSFLGIILIYGEIGSLTSPAVIPYLTPFFGALGIIFFYLLTRRLFSERIGLISAALLAVFPVYVYYSVRSMFHNVLFIVLLIIGFYFLIVALDRSYLAVKKIKFKSWQLPRNVRWGWVFIFLSGLFVGLAVITRTSELLWLGPVLLIILLFYGRRLGLSKIIIFINGLILGLLPALYFNLILYQSPFYGGYGQMNQSIVTITRASTDLVKHTVAAPVVTAAATSTSIYHQLFNSIFHTIFYFGFDTKQSWNMFLHYVILMFPWLVWLSGFGLAALAAFNFSKPKKKYLVYLLIWVTLSAILVLYYGSWRFTDNPDASRYTIGNSYTRYWLPMYLMALPLAALAIEFGLRVLFLFFRKRNYYKALVAGGAAVIVLLIASSSINFLLFGSEEGLVNLYYNTNNNKQLGNLVFSLTPPQSIIMTEYHDKILFPERQVIMGRIAEEAYYPYINKLLENYPFYYFNFKYTPETAAYLNNGRLAKNGLQMKLIKETGNGFALYQITKLKK